MHRRAVRVESLYLVDCLQRCRSLADSALQKGEIQPRRCLAWVCGYDLLKHLHRFPNIPTGRVDHREIRQRTGFVGILGESSLIFFLGIGWPTDICSRKPNRT